MTPAQAQDRMEVTGPHGVGILLRGPNGWDLRIELGDLRLLYQSIDLSTHEPTITRPPIVEIHTGDRIATKVIGKKA